MKNLPYTVHSPTGEVMAAAALPGLARYALATYCEVFGEPEGRTLRLGDLVLWTEGRDADGCASFNDGGAEFGVVVSTREHGVTAGLDRRGAREWATAFLGHNAVVSGDPRRKGAAQARVGVALVGGGIEIYGSSDVDWTAACVDALKTLDQKRAALKAGA